MAQDSTADGPASGGKAGGRYGVEVAGEAVVEGVEESGMGGSTQEYRGEDRAVGGGGETSGGGGGRDGNKAKAASFGEVVGNGRGLGRRRSGERVTPKGGEEAHDIVAQGERHTEMQGRGGGESEVGSEGKSLDAIMAEQVVADRLEERAARREANEGQAVGIAVGVAVREGGVGTKDNARQRRRGRRVREERRDDGDGGAIEARPEGAEETEGQWKGMAARARSEARLGGFRKAQEARAGQGRIVGDEGQMATMVHDQSTELVVSKQAEGSRRAVDQMPPGRNQGRIDARYIWQCAK